MIAHVLSPFWGNVHFRYVQPENGITISEVMQLLHSGATADLTVVTLDMGRNTGGKRIELKQARLTGTNHSTKKNGTITLREHHRHDFPMTVHVALIEKCNGRPVL